MELKVGLVVKTDIRAEKKARKLEKWLKQRDVEVVHAPSNIDARLVSDELFVVFVLGGDGTFLSAARWVASSGIPILGIKFGRLGFLAETVEADLFTTVNLVLENRFEIEPRTLLFVKVTRNKQVIASRIVLNDVVINKGALARLANIHTWIDKSFLTIYRGDGLIISTPTGSTAYSLAAGGPVIHPDVPGIIMTPICPFTLTNRPLILHDSVKIKIKLEKDAEDIMLTFDGQEGFELRDTDLVFIEKADFPINMITMPGQNYYDILKTKLRWSGGKL